MKPLFASDLPAIAATTRRQTLSVEPCLVVARLQGEVIAASSCVMRLDTEAGPIYLFPRADVATEIRATGRVSRGGPRIWSVRARCGAMKAAAYSPPFAGSAGDRVAFDPDIVEVVPTPSRGREIYRMM
jgi:uncharacterized protein (DUF427 family)